MPTVANHTPSVCVLPMCVPGMCVCCPCVFLVCVCVLQCLHMWRPEVDLAYCSQLLSTSCLRPGLSLSLSGLFLIGLACLPSTLHQGYRCMPPHLVLNSGPHACTADSLPLSHLLTLYKHAFRSSI